MAFTGGEYLFNTGRLRPKGIPYSGFRLGIALVEVYKMKVGKLVISVCIKAGLTDAFYGYEKVKKTSWFSDFLYFLTDSAFTVTKRK